MTVTPFDGDDCTGGVGNTVTLEFEVVASPTTPPPPEPEPEPEALGKPGRPTLILQ